MSDIVDLDVFVGPPRRVKVGGEEYLLPRDLPAELYLEILDMQTRSDEIDDDVVVRKLREDLLDMFRVHQPELDRLPAAITIPVLVQAIGHIYGGGAEERPTKPRSGSRGTTKRKPTPKPRSRSSR